MKLQDIQSALLKDKETLFQVKGERHNKYFVIESLETKEETYGNSWNLKTRTVNYAVGTWYWFVASEEGRTSYNGSWIEAKPARFIDGKFRCRINAVEALGYDLTLSEWQHSWLTNDALRVAKETERAHADKHIAQVLTESLGVPVSVNEVHGISKNLREALLHHFFFSDFNVSN
jgi:hypothetical protein